MLTSGSSIMTTSYGQTGIRVWGKGLHRFGSGTPSCLRHFCHTMGPRHRTSRPAAISLPMKVIESASAAWISLGIIVRNEEKAIGPALESLFRQSLFAELEKRGLTVEIWCVANDCTDATVEVATRIFHQHGVAHPHRHVFAGR